MTENDIRQMLAKKFAKRGAQFAWGEAHDISPGYVSDFLAGKRGIGPAILNALNLETHFRPRRKRACGQAEKGA